MPTRHRTFYKMMRYTHVIWDFNGTILDDVQAGIRAINRMLADRSLPLLATVEAYRAVFGFPVEDYYRRIGLDLEREDFKTVLAPEWVALYNEYSKEAPLYEGVQRLTRRLHACGVQQSILSASERAMLEGQLAERGALDWFDEIYATDSIHAYGKLALADAWCREHEGARAVLLGDTLHDFEVAQRMGVDCILVAAGHHSFETLSACGVPTVHDLDECAALLEI